MPGSNFQLYLIRSIRECLTQHLTEILVHLLITVFLVRVIISALNIITILYYSIVIMLSALNIITILYYCIAIKLSALTPKH